MIPVSVVIPTRNEEINLPRCLDCLSGFSEIVVVDSASSDRTVQIAESVGARVEHFDWNGTFPKKRNWALRNCSFGNEWVLFVDADEYVTDEFKEEVLRILPATQHSGFWLTYHNYFMGRLLKHGDKFRKLALFRVGTGEYERIEENNWSNLDMEVHEHPVITGSVGKLRTPIVHEDFKGLNAYVRRHNEYSDWEARRYCTVKRRPRKVRNCSALTRRQRVKYAMVNSWVLAPLYFIVSYVFKAGFLDGREGFMFAVFKMHYFFQIKCKIMELRLKQRG